MVLYCCCSTTLLREMTTMFCLFLLPVPPMCASINPFLPVTPFSNKRSTQPALHSKRRDKNPGYTMSCCCCSQTNAEGEAKVTDSQRRIQRLSRHLHRNTTAAAAADTTAFTPYNEADAAEYIKKYGQEWGEDLALRCYTSHLIGRDPNLVLHGGGNTGV